MLQVYEDYPQEDESMNTETSNRRSLDVKPGPSFSTLISGSRRQRRRGQRRKMGSQRQRFQNSGDTIPGTPGTDFPDFRSIPLTQFSCLDGSSNGGTRRPGFYADVETQCQVSIFETINFKSWVLKFGYRFSNQFFDPH